MDDCLEVRGYVDEIEIRNVSYESRRGIEILVCRRVKALQQTLTDETQRPAWEAFVHARQGSE